MQKLPQDRSSIKEMLESPWFEMTEEEIEDQLLEVQNGNVKQPKVVTLKKEEETKSQPKSKSSKNVLVAKSKPRINLDVSPFQKRSPYKRQSPRANN